MESMCKGGLTAPEFFSLGREGCSMQDAHLATRIAYSTIHRHARGGKDIDPDTARKLQAWSFEVTEGEVWISAARTLGLTEPDEQQDACDASTGEHSIPADNSAQVPGERPSLAETA